MTNKNEKRRISRWRSVFYLAAAVGGGLLSSSALPPLNWSECAFFAFVPLLLLSCHLPKIPVFFLGMAFGWTWGFTAFNFLREIQGSFGAIPYILATVLSLYFGVFALAVRAFHRYLRLNRNDRLASFSDRVANPPRYPWWRELVFCIAVSAAYLMLEWGRAWALPWNYLAITQYRNPALLQIARFGGTYLVGFTIIFVNAALAAALDSGYVWSKLGRHRFPWALTAALLILTASGVSGALRLIGRAEADNYGTDRIRADFGLVQGNISQRRRATAEEAREALTINFELAEQLRSLVEPPDIVVMPESASPIPYSDGSQSGYELRSRIYNFVSKSQRPLLTGVIDYEPDGSGDWNTFNRAARFVPGQLKYVDKFDKIQRVPFGEFVPFRRWLPDFAVRLIDMGRDLTPGTDYSPIEVLPGFRAGMSICFEDVFPSVARREAQLGANLLLVITNDAWYPESSEPEQHFANCLLRTIETGLPMVRCGNNSSSVVVDRFGIVTDGLLKDASGAVDPIGKARVAGVVEVTALPEPEPTFYVKYGEWFVYLMLTVFVAALLFCATAWYGDCRVRLGQLNIKL